MATSIFLAKLIGPIFLAVGVGMLVNAAVFRALAEEFLRSHALLFLSGLLAMTAGVAIVLVHPVWVANWPVIITILGLLLYLGGALRIIWPQQSQAVGRWFLARPAAMTVGAIVWLALGVVLCFVGYS